MIEKASIDKLIVLKSGVTLASGNTRLFNPATGADGLSVSQAGIFTPVAGSGSPQVPANSTAVAGVNYIEVIKRRNTTGDKSPLPDRFYERSGLISTDCIHGLEWSGATAETGTSQSILVGAPDAAADAITPTDNTTYTFVITADGKKTDKIYGKNTVPTLSVTQSFGEFGVSPDLVNFTTTQQARDYLISSIINKHNVLSSNQGDVLSIGVAISTTNVNFAGALNYSLTAINALTVGSQLTIGYNDNNSPVNVLLTADVKNALVALLTEANAKSGLTSASIVAYAMPTAANITALGISETAGGQGVGLPRIDMFGLIAVDIEDAFYDETFSHKRRLNLGLDTTQGFTTATYVKEASPAKVSTGIGADILQWYKNIEHYKQYTSSKDYGALHIAYPNDIEEGGYYDVYSLYYCNNRQSTGGFPAMSPRRLVVAIPNFTVGDAASNVFYTGTANPQKAQFETYMNSFVSKVGLPAVSL